MSILTDFSPVLPGQLSGQLPGHHGVVVEAPLSTAQRRRVIASAEVHRDASAIAAAWRTLEQTASISPYQTQAFLLAWLETIGARRKIAPLFILGRDIQERPVALLCLGIERHGPFRIAVFLGGKESNFNLGLFARDAALLPADLDFLLKAAVKALGRAAPQLFLLQNQPLSWDGAANPFADLPHQPSPSFAYATELAPNGEKFLAARLSKDTRKKLRKKAARLADFGPVALVSNAEPEAAQAVVDAFLAEKIARGEERGYETDFADPSMRAFLERLAVPKDGGAPFLEFYGLKAGERIVATYAGAAHREHFSCLVNSFDIDPEIAKSSPGELLLMQLVALQCDRGLKTFDLGIGEARYKSGYCDVTVPLFDSVLPVGPVGRLCAAYAALRLHAKRLIKQQPKIFSSIRRLRQMIPGLALL